MRSEELRAACMGGDFRAPLWCSGSHARQRLGGGGALVGLDTTPRQLGIYWCEAAVMARRRASVSLADVVVDGANLAVSDAAALTANEAAPPATMVPKTYGASLTTPRMPRRPDLPSLCIR